MKNKILFVIKGLKITPNFKEKLTHNFHELTVLEMLIYLIFIRSFWDKKRRFFFEGSLALPGQMYIAERKVLFDVIKEKKPRHCFEVGTYTGGGSTYFISKAFESVGSGHLVTLENDPYFYNKAKKYYAEKIPVVAKHVEFMFGDKAQDFDKIIKLYVRVDCAFLDGAEDSNQTLSQYNYFLPFFHKGTILMVHDWNTEKTRELKPILLRGGKWRVYKEVKPPESVGLIVFEML
ncbi:MAG: class I SAM-dependent methyltransferase [Candidatus Yonathbacteria bacterium]|nr:class I SAM-dependent methyltransferase [Candidatus Yonathbacteria bacterium]